MTGPLLSIQGLAASYKGVEALRGIDLHVNVGEIVVVLGANGAGKTTLMRAACRMISTTGKVELDGRGVTRASTEKLALLGVGHVPEGRGTFVDLTVEENLRLGQMAAPRDQRDPGFLDEVLELFPVLAEMRARRAGSLSGGQQQILAIARALLGRPRLLIIDELSLGLAPLVTQEIFGKLDDLRRRNALAILLAEQNVHLSLQVADRGYVLDSGSLVAEGPADELAHNGAVERAYLGR